MTSGLPNTDMELSELKCIVSKFDTLSDYSDSETEIFKHPDPRNLQSLLRPCLKRPSQQTSSSPTTPSAKDGVAAECRKTARFAAAHLLARCLVTGRVVPTREEERAAAIDGDGLDAGGGDRRRQQRRQKRARQRAGQKQHGGGGNLLDDELAFHQDIGGKSDHQSSCRSKTAPTTPRRSTLKEAASTKGEAATDFEPETVGPKDDNLPTDTGEESASAEDPEELALDETLIEACRNAAVNSGDTAPLRSIKKFAWQRRWAGSRDANRLGLNS
ncbi:hypothetical protein PpBr36_00029 [Pyricularia pennisetigena]|uniref:hypothetical protein n=1 Tax=Pyricularia pennisetigena TaxID=1578925 RepID=UPI0011547B3E|nr:hypothetical protein PpBr36_00029 [Pyricularia pennisetigena]TLS29249.1 hypothetical protein PpBr36_00029 [Pyricularia pennisetigena]